MKSITAFLSAAAQHLRTETCYSPVEPRFTAARTQPITSTRIAHRAPATKESPAMSSHLFIRSPLAANTRLPQTEIDRFCVIYNDEEVQRASGELRAARARVADLASYRSGIAEAIEIADQTGTAVIEVLRRLIDDADNEIEATRADHKAHDSVTKARRELLLPLVIAVGRLSASAGVERQMLQNHIDACTSRHVSGGASANRFAALQAAGLSNDEINGLGVPQPELKLQELRDRAAELDRVQAQCAAFGADPYKRGRHLEGLGLDGLIEAQRLATEQVPA